MDEHTPTSPFFRHIACSSFTQHNMIHTTNDRTPTRKQTRLPYVMQRRRVAHPALETESHLVNIEETDGSNNGKELLHFISPSNVDGTENRQCLKRLDGQRHEGAGKPVRKFIHK